LGYTNTKREKRNLCEVIIVMSKLIPVRYNKNNYPAHIKCEIQEVAGNFDKEALDVTSPYSLHTEYSYMPRTFNSKILHDLFQLKTAHKENVPKLWYNKEWANEFYIFIERLVGLNNPPEVIEIHPPFKEYCNSFEQFIDVFNIFYDIIILKYPNVKIFIENRCGTFYKGSKFLLSTCSDVLQLCNILKKINLNLKIVLDYPQIFSAEKINMDNISLKKILAFNMELIKYIDIIGGFHMWGKKKSEKGRWVSHAGNFNTFFSNDNELKYDYLNSVINTFNDNITRYFVPEINSGKEDLFSIVTDLEQAGFIFVSNNAISYQLIRIKWENEQPLYELYNRTKGEIVYKKALGKFSIHVKSIRHCIGSYELGTHKYIPCKNDIIIKEKKTCKECEKYNGFEYCVSCHGEKCVTFNKDAIEYCNHKHFVYLAYFPDQIIKVGTAHELRKEERLIEQGALYRILIAKTPTGKLARLIENKISKLGYKSSVTSKYKIQNLYFSRSEYEIHELLNTAYEHIKQNLEVEFNDYFIKPYIYNKNSQIVESLNRTLRETEQLQLTLIDDIFKPQYNIVSNISNKNVEIVAFVGSISLFKDEINNYYAYDFKELYGCDIIIS